MEDSTKKDATSQNLKRKKPKLSPCEAFPPSKPATPKSFSYHLGEVVSAATLTEISQSGIMAFHCIGDTGGGFGDGENANTRAVAALMQSQLNSKPQSQNNQPCFCYHVGDIIYNDGESAYYNDEFYEPYQIYQNPILAIPGNHDAKDKHILKGFRVNFLNSEQEPTKWNRSRLNLPYYYWTLDTPLGKVIGLCAIGNCIDNTQHKWFMEQMKDAANETDKFLVVAVHYPPYTYDAKASGTYDAIVSVLDDAIQKHKRIPDLVLSGHSHNYQRIMVKSATGCSYPSIITGAGGHGLTLLDPTRSIPNATLEKGNSQQFGALEVVVNANDKTITASYYTVDTAQIVNGGSAFDQCVVSFPNSLS